MQHVQVQRRISDASNPDTQAGPWYYKAYRVHMTTLLTLDSLARPNIYHVISGSHELSKYVWAACNCYKIGSKLFEYYSWELCKCFLILSHHRFHCQLLNIHHVLERWSVPLHLIRHDY